MKNTSDNILTLLTGIVIGALGVYFMNEDTRKKTLTKFDDLKGKAVDKLDNVQDMAGKKLDDLHSKIEGHRAEALKGM